MKSRALKIEYSSENKLRDVTLSDSEESPYQDCEEILRLRLRMTFSSLGVVPLLGTVALL